MTTDNSHREEETTRREIRLVRMLDNLDRMGGLERQAIQICNRLPDYGYDVHLVCADAAGEAALELMDERITLHEIHYNAQKKFNPGSYLAAYRLIKRLQPDIFVGSLAANYKGRTAAVLAGVPVIISHSGSARPKGTFIKRIKDRLLAPYTNLYTCPSAGVAEAEKVRVGRPNLPTHIIYNNIDIQQYRQEARGSSDIRQEIGASGETVVFLAVGRMVWEKAFDLLLEAWGRLEIPADSARLVLVGDGELKADLETLATDLRLSTSVCFLGWREDVPGLIASADVLVMSSITEGAANVLLEAAALQTPCVSTNPPGSNVSVYMADGESGFIVQPGSETALVEGLRRMLDLSPAQRREMGRQAFEHVSENFAFDTPKDNVSELNTIFRKLLASKEAREY